MVSTPSRPRASMLAALALLTSCSLLRDFDALTRDTDSTPPGPSGDGGRGQDGAIVACPDGGAGCPAPVAGVPQEVANERAPVTSLTRGPCGVIWGSPSTGSVRGIVAAGGPVVTVFSTPGRTPGHVACNADTVFATDTAANEILVGSGSTITRDQTWSAPTHIAAPSDVLFYESAPTTGPRCKSCSRAVSRPRSTSSARSSATSSKASPRRTRRPTSGADLWGSSTATCRLTTSS